MELPFGWSPQSVLIMVGGAGTAVGLILIRRITHVDDGDPPSIFRDHDLEPRYEVPEPDERVKVDD